MMRQFGRHLFIAAFALGAFDGAASAATPEAKERATAAQPALAAGGPRDSHPTVVAHPALWQVHGKRGTLYLLGSLHLLPPDVDWRTPEISRAIQSADVFVFEVPDDPTTQQKLKAVIAAEGGLAPGQSLRAELTPKAQSDYDTDLAALGLQPVPFDHARPWLASLVMGLVQMQRESGGLGVGPDFALAREADADHKERRYLETIEQQIALIVPSDRTVELEEFESTLADARKEKDEYTELVAAWTQGDVAKIDAIASASFAGYPAAKKTMVDDRNRAWVGQLEKMLDDDKTVFVTVGAAHLAGPGGVPALLRAAGYRVDGP